MKHLIFILMVVGGLAACSAKVEGDAASPAPIKEAFENKIKGPDVEGVWTSTCLYDSFEGAYKVMRAEFKGATLQRSSNLYSDNGCKQISKKVEVKGIFRWAQTTTYGGFQVDYKLDLGNGWTSNTKEEVFVDKDVMYLSEYRVGFGFIDKSFPMKRSTSTPSEKACSDFTGVYFSNGYMAISQKQCAELYWQELNSDLTPAKTPDVFVTDKVPRQSGNSFMASYFAGSSFILEIQKSGRSTTVLKFKIESVDQACGIHLGGVKTILLRKGYVNNVEDVDYCSYWEKLK